MTAVLLTLAVAAAGGAGAMCRAAADSWVRSRWGAQVPTGIVLVNITGSFALGLAHGAWVLTAPALLLVVGTGFLGGWTTFSTAMLDAVGLLRAGEVRRAMTAVVVAVVLSVAGAALGVTVGARL